MENKPQEEKIKELIAEWADSSNRDLVLSAIQFGSRLTAKAAKEKVSAIKDVEYYHQRIEGTIDRDETLQAIEESTL